MNALAKSLFTLEQKLALLITSTIVIVLAISLSLTYGALTTSAEKEVSEHFASVSHQLTTGLAASRDRTRDSLTRLARSDAVVAALTADGDRVRGAVRAARNELSRFRPGGANYDTLSPIELWTSSGRRLTAVGRPVAIDLPEHVAGDSVVTALPGSLIAVRRPGIARLPARDSIAVGELYADSGKVYYWTVAPVTTRDTARADSARSDTASSDTASSDTASGDIVLGYIAQRVPFVITPQTALAIRELTGEEVTLTAHNRDGRFWASALTGVIPARVARDSIGPAQFYDAPEGRTIALDMPVAGVPWIPALETPLRAVHQRARELLMSIAGLGVLLTVVGAIVSVVVGRRIARPLAGLTTAADAIAKGDYARRVPRTGDDEIGRLGATFNQMAAEVGASRQELERRFEETRASAAELERSNEQLRAAKEEAERSREEAQHANRAKSDFLAVMSHELRTPLNAIGGYTQLLDLGIHGPVTDAQHDALHRITRSQAHLLRLINDVLNFARVDAGKVRYAMRDVLLDETMAGIEPLIAPQMSAKGLTYHYTRCEPALSAYTDSDKLLQIALNLLTNAIKFTPQGGSVFVTCDAQDDEVRIHVRDTGVGIPPERAAVIFDPFVQLDRTATQSMDGVGLGLAISRDLARGMGGDLEVASTPGAGSTFTVILPARAASFTRRAAVAEHA